MIENSIPKKSKHFRINWWMIGFFVVLLAFEVAREMAVIFANEPARPFGGSYSFYKNEDFFKASGSWIRSGDGSKIIPQTTTIECAPYLGGCITATVSSYENRYTNPYIDVFFDAVFRNGGVSYVDASPMCATLYVNIDTTQSRVTATRVKKTGDLPAEICGPEMEDRVTMELGSYPRSHGFELGDHFVPILRALRSMGDG